MKHIKYCKKCNQDKPLSEYQKCIKNGINIGQAYCRVCRNNMNTWSAKTNPTSNPISNPKSMYVNGKYVSRQHPLYKPGRYKTFEGAAFSALEGYDKSTDGHVYIISNPCWDGWFKVGMAVDPEDRCNSYQTSSPFRDYKLCYNKHFKDRRTAEKTAHKKLRKKSTKYKGEWFKVSINEAIKIIDTI